MVVLQIYFPIPIDTHSPALQHLLSEGDHALCTASCTVGTGHAPQQATSSEEQVLNQQVYEGLGRAIPQWSDNQRLGQQQCSIVTVLTHSHILLFFASSIVFTTTHYLVYTVLISVLLLPLSSITLVS